MAVSVLDVAKYILNNDGSMSAMKLQKLCYYSQAWHLVWDDEILFSDRIEAWANGPVAPTLYDKHRGLFTVRADQITGARTAKLDRSQRESIDSVRKFYGKKSGAQLSELTHREAPWREARRGVAPGEPSTKAISVASMAEYYGSLLGNS